MFRIMMKSKIHRATVTEANVDYVGSVTIDSDLMKAADILPHEKVQIADITNGARLETYAIEGPAGSGVVCPHCQQGAKFHGYREKAALSLLGSVVCQRAYYYCGRCGKGVLPWDDQVGLTARSFTPAAERLVSLAGALSDSFAEAAEKVLPEMAGLKVAETTVQRTTEGVGERIADHRRSGGTFGFARPWNWYRDVSGRTCALHQFGSHRRAAAGRRRQSRRRAHAVCGHGLQPRARTAQGLPPSATCQRHHASALSVGAVRSR